MGLASSSLQKVSQMSTNFRRTTAVSGVSGLILSYRLLCSCLLSILLRSQTKFPVLHYEDFGGTEFSTIGCLATGPVILFLLKYATFEGVFHVLKDKKLVFFQFFYIGTLES